MTISLIAAVGKRGQLGLNGVMPWHDSEDLQWFKKLTLEQTVVVGSKTAEKLPKLSNRLVVTFRRDMNISQIIETFTADGENLWIAGGEKVYSLWMPYIDRYYISRIDYDGEADTWMPKLGWQN